MQSRIGRVATGLALTIGTTFTAGSGIAIHANTAHASTPRTSYGTFSPGPNPWNFTMTDGTKDGMTINGTPNSLAQIFLVKDPYGAPIFAVGHVGGATTFGDHIRLIGDAGFSTPVFDVDTHGTITLTGSAPKIVIGGQTLTADDIAWIHSHE